jgi:hypothetical protein
MAPRAPEKWTRDENRWMFEHIQAGLDGTVARDYPRDRFRDRTDQSVVSHYYVCLKAMSDTSFFAEEDALLVRNHGCPELGKPDRDQLQSFDGKGKSSNVYDLRYEYLVYRDGNGKPLPETKTALTVEEVAASVMVLTQHMESLTRMVTKLARHGQAELALQAQNGKEDKANG